MLPNRLSWEVGALACVIDETLAFETSFVGHEGECGVEEVLKALLLELRGFVVEGWIWGRAFACFSVKIL